MITVMPETLESLACDVLVAIGCDKDIATEIATHLVESDLRGVSSHGTMRLTQYAKQAQTGYLDPAGRPEQVTSVGGRVVIDGNRGFGHPAMALAVRRAIATSQRAGSGIVAVRNCGHTGRIGHYAEMAAKSGLASIIGGGGCRERWPQVAPHGGIDPKLPTNPWAFGFPGDHRGPIVADFATGMVSGGRTMAAHKQGVDLPGDFVLTIDGEISSDPAAYLNGGAIRPAAGPKGFGMGLVAELLATAMLGTDTPESNWIIIVIDCSSYRSLPAIVEMVTEIVDDVCSSRPEPGGTGVEIPGQREHAMMLARRRQGIPMYANIWSELTSLREQLC